MDVPVDVYLLISLVFLAVVSSLLVLGMVTWKFLRSPEFRFRIRRIKWVYALMKTRLGELREHLIPISEIEKSNNSFHVGGGMYFWRTQDKQGRQTVFPYKKKLAAIYKRGVSFPEAFTEESLSALGGYSSEDFVNILESEVERNIVEAMRPKRIPWAITIGILLLAIIGSTIYLSTAISGVNHVAAGTTPTVTTTVQTGPCTGYNYIAAGQNYTVPLGHHYWNPAVGPISPPTADGVTPVPGPECWI